MTDLGIPDWRDVAGYGDMAHWPGARWRWEFTRRREDYRKDFDKASKLTQSELNDRRRLDDRGRVVTTANVFARKYGLAYLLNYRISDQPTDWLRFDKPFGGVVTPIKEESATMLIPRGVAAVTFDLAKSIDRQWRDARKGLISLQSSLQSKRPINPRKHKSKWASYIRVLDARAADATWKEIGRSDVLGKHVRSNNSPADAPQAARQVWEAARHLMFNWPN